MHATVTDVANNSASLSFALLAADKRPLRAVIWQRLRFARASGEQQQWGSECNAVTGGHRESQLFG